MKIALVSTAYPLRGGIAQYTGILYHKLIERGHEVHVLTFKRQYPALLFPGKTQLETSSDAGVEIPTEPIIDSISPLSWWRTGRRLRQLQSDLVILKFWMPFFAPCFGVICRLAKRWTRARILYICDNVIPHERRPGDLAMTRFALRPADHFVVQSGVVARDLLSLLPNVDYKFIPHPVYDIFGAKLPKSEARQKLKISEEHVILFFGYVRAYKGLDVLLNAMPEILKSVKLRLLVVGEFYEDEEKYRTQAHRLGISDAVSFYADFIPNEEVAPFFSAADVVVLPYKSATQSGIVQMAYHFDKPCIVSDVGGLSEVVLHNKTGFVVPAEAPGSLAEAVVTFYREGKEAEFSAAVQQEKKKYSWEKMVGGIEDFGHD